MAVVLKAAEVVGAAAEPMEEDRLSFASYSYSSEYGGQSQAGVDEDVGAIEFEYIEPVAAREIRVFGDGSILPAGAFLSHGALMTIDGLPGTYVYKDEHEHGIKRAAEVKFDADDEVEQERALALADRVAAAPPGLERPRAKPYWSRVEAVPKPALYLYRSLISAQIILKGFECTFAKLYVPERWERSDLSWVKKGAWVEFNPANKLPEPKLGVVCIDPIPSRGFSEIKIRFVDGTESDYIQTDSSEMQRCVVTQLVFVCDEHEAHKISHALRRARDHGHPKHHGNQYELKLKGKGQVTFELATKGATVTEHPEGPVKYNYRRVYPTTDGRIRKRHPMRSARTPSGDFPDANPPPNTPHYESELGLDPPVEHFLGDSPKPEDLLEPWVEPEPAPEQVPPTWREIRQAEIEAEVDAKQQLSEKGIFGRLFGCGRGSKTRNSRRNKNYVYALEKSDSMPKDEDKLGVSEPNTMEMEPITEEEEDFLLWPCSQSSDDQSDYSLQQQSDEEAYSSGRFHDATDESDQQTGSYVIIDRAVQSNSMAPGPEDAVAPWRYEALASSPIYQDALLDAEELDMLAKGEVIVALARQEVDGIGWVQCSLGWVRSVDDNAKALLSLVAPVDAQAPSMGLPGLKQPHEETHKPVSTDGTDHSRPVQDTVSTSPELQIEGVDLVHAAGDFAATEAANESGWLPEDLSGGSWVDLRSTLLQNKPGAVVTMEGAVWWPQIRPPLTSKQKNLLAKREKVKKRLASKNATSVNPESTLEALAPDPPVLVERLAQESVSMDATQAAVTQAVADLISEVEAKWVEGASKSKERTNGAIVKVPDRGDDYDRQLVEEMQGATVESILRPEAAERPDLVTKDPEAEQAVPDNTVVTREPDVLQPRDTLEERMAKMDSWQDRWMKRTQIEEQQLVKTANMVTVETFMDEEYAFNLKTAEELVDELTWAPPQAQHAVSEWFYTIGLGHIEPQLQDRIYDDRFQDEFLQSLCGPGGMTFVESLDGGRISELIKLLELGPPAETVFRQELHRRTKNPEHAPLPGMVMMADKDVSKNSQEKGTILTTKKKTKNKNKKKKKQASPSSLEGKEEEIEETAQEQFERIMREEAAAAKAAEEAAAVAQAALLEDSERAAGRNTKKKKKKNAKKKAQNQEDGDASPKPGAQVAAQAENENQPKAKKKNQPKAKKKKTKQPKAEKNNY
eukprot:COSAG02_NODE_242_length_27511_cov_501.886364_17_plen_1195_part_00